MDGGLAGISRGECTLDKADVREAYDRLAPWYDLLELVPDHLLGVSRRRRRLLRRAQGRVLEVAVGTGRNLAHYPPGCCVTGLDASRGMLERIRTRAGPADGKPAVLVRGDTEALPFRADRFDTVVDSMALCTYQRPVRALREMSRVCRPGGRILLLEHGRSSREALARFQDRHADALVRRVGCHWNREPTRIVTRAGLEVTAADRGLLGILHAIEAAPTA